MGYNPFKQLGISSTSDTSVYTASDQLKHYIQPEIKAKPEEFKFLAVLKMLIEKHKWDDRSAGGRAAKAINKHALY